MNQFLKRSIEQLPFYSLLRNWAVKRRLEQDLAAWEQNGRPVPPPHLVKQHTLKEYSNRFGLKVLVETGTYYGDMVEAMKEHFDQVYSIELSQALFKRTKKRFQGVDNVELICGDSAIELGNVVKKLEGPALFWLDGHYSAGITAHGDKNTPIFEELMHILPSQDMRHVIIIDDARCFGTAPDYPSIPALTDFIRSKSPHVDIVVQHDSIRVTPK